MLIVTGVANIVTKPITAKITNETAGKVLYVNINNNINGQVVIIEK